MVKQRIEYIDLAKGFCIGLVVFAHIHPDLNQYSWGVFFDSFRMPLYFFLSGIFFKEYSGLGEFAVKKFNTLIIPLLFFDCFAMAYDAISYAISALYSLDTSAYESQSWFPFWVLAHMGSSWHNPPLWFLTALFEVNILYYILHKYLHRRWLDVGVLLLAGIGYIFAQKQFFPPYYLGTALVSLPFFHTGYYLNKSKLLLTPPYPKCLYISILPLTTIVWFLAQPIRLHELRLPENPLTFYACGILGSICVIFLCKLMYGKFLRWIAYYGRYSLIVFGTHFCVYNTFMQMVTSYMPADTLAYLSIFTLTMLSEIGFIELLRRYAPTMTAQRECISYSAIQKKLGWLVRT